MTLTRRRLAPVRASMEERLSAWSVPEPNSGCHLWIGFTTKDGYGRIFITGKGSAFAHRVAYETHVAPIPPGLTIDHLCGNTACINVSMAAVVRELIDAEMRKEASQ